MIGRYPTRIREVEKWNDRHGNRVCIRSQRKNLLALCSKPRSFQEFRVRCLYSLVGMQSRGKGWVVQHPAQAPGLGVSPENATSHHQADCWAVEVELSAEQRDTGEWAPTSRPAGESLPVYFSNAIPNRDASTASYRKVNRLALQGLSHNDIQVSTAPAQWCPV